MKIIILIFCIVLSSCSSKIISLKPIDVWGSNEQRIPEPTLE